MKNIFDSMEETLVAEAPTDIDTTGEAKVILFNDDYHSFNDVITQLIKAIRCTIKVAEGMAQTVHTQGKCDVYRGEVEECLNVSAVLEEIHLKTTIDFN